jgi:diguanylate cyclase (GGDEF)-like protein
MEKLAITDPLMGAFNRRHFCEVGIRELARAKRSGSRLSIIMFDLDHFKRINDTAGHHIGDEVLKTVVARLRPSLRESDTLGRIGGEEFFILLPETAGEAAAASAERFRSLIESIDSIRPGNTAIRFTASFGVHEVEVETSDFGAVSQKVDAARYKAKAAGRNCVIRLG